MREPVIPQLTSDEYFAWERRQHDRFELHHGFIVSFAGGTTNHDLIGFNVRVVLKRAFPSPCRTFGSDLKIQVADSTVYYADAGVDCEPLDGSATVLTTPRIVCEVLSESTRRYDLIEKRQAYRSMPSVEVYLVVHTRSRRVEMDTNVGDVWQISVIDEGSFPLGSTHATLDEIYAGSSVEAIA